MWEMLLLPLFGFLIALAASLTGVGGGIFIVPLLVILYGILPQQAVGTSLASVVFTAAAATYSYARQKRIFYRTGLLLALTTVPGAYLGAFLTTVASSRVVGLIFGVFLFLIALRMICSRDPGHKAGKARLISPPATTDLELVKSAEKLGLGMGMSFFAGVASGFLGVGGGILGVPIMNLGLGMPIHSATATSMFTMIFTSISGVAKHAQADHVIFHYALLLAAGTIFGAQVGAGFSKKVTSPALRRIFGLLLLLVSLQMIIKFA